MRHAKSSHCGDSHSGGWQDTGSTRQFAHGDVPEPLGLRLILLAADKGSNVQISKQSSFSRGMVEQWRERFVRERLEAVTDRPRSGWPRAHTEEDGLRAMETTCTKAPPGETHWSPRGSARATGARKGAVQHILRESNLRSHRAGTFSRSHDDAFAGKALDVVGLYTNPPENSIVVCVDQKALVQALDRTQRMLPMWPDQIELHTHDYKGTRYSCVPRWKATPVGRSSALRVAGDCASSSRS